MRRSRGRSRRLEAAPGELMLAAMVDMMINLLIFLLHLYGNTPVEVKASAELQFPEARVADPMRTGVVVRVTRAGIEIDGRPAVAFEEVDGRLQVPATALADGQIAALATFLAEKRANPPAGATPGDPQELPEILMQCDKRVPWSALSAVVRTAGESGYPRMRFVVAHDEGVERGG